MELAVNGDLRQIYKTSTRSEYDDEEVITIGSNQHELNLTDAFYECLVLALPVRRIHKEDDCDPAVLEALRKIEVKEEHQSDPRWNALRGLAG